MQMLPQDFFLSNFLVMFLVQSLRHKNANFAGRPARHRIGSLSSTAAEETMVSKKVPAI
jgi:hypothetical protein